MNKTFNVGDALLIVCKGFSYTAKIAAGSEFLAITRSSPVSYIGYTSAVSNGFTSFSIRGGELIFDTYNGNQPGFDHILVTVSATVPSGVNANRAFLTVYVPYLRPADAGKYYCSFMDGSSLTSSSTNLSSSSVFQLIVNSKSSSTSLKKSTSNIANKYPTYSLLILSSIKLIF